jgi:hypothetical protein
LRGMRVIRISGTRPTHDKRRCEARRELSLLLLLLLVCQPPLKRADTASARWKEGITNEVEKVPTRNKRRRKKKCTKKTERIDPAPPLYCAVKNKTKKLAIGSGYTKPGRKL